MQKGWTQMAIETCAIMPKQRKLTINVHEYHTTQVRIKRTCSFTTIN